MFRQRLTRQNFIKHNANLLRLVFICMNTGDTVITKVDVMRALKVFVIERNRTEAACL